MGKTLIIAEAGVNHNGKLDIALKLCDAAKEAGADVVKFQTWQTDKIITKNVAQAEYQIENTGKTESQYDMLKRLELSYGDFRKIKEHCDQIGIQFASTADEKWSLDFLIELGIPFIKISSGEVTNIPYLRYMGSKKLPVILSTGMSYLSDVDVAIRTLKEAGCPEITVLHCTTNYPCLMEDVNLNAMLTMRDTFRLPIGYSDHTKGIEVSIAAVALGAVVIEKHFTLNKKMEGPDHIASTEPPEFKKMVESIRNIENAMGCNEKKPSAIEKKISEVVLKRIVASKDIVPGELFSEDNLTVKRNDKGISAKYWNLIIGMKAKRRFFIEEPIDLGGGVVEIKKADLNDFDFFYQIKTNPDNMYWCGYKNIPRKSNLLAFWEKNIGEARKNQNRMVYMITYNSDNVGYIYLDTLFNKKYEVSIAVIDMYSGLKIASNALTLILKELKYGTIIANIRHDNFRSINLFQKLGFVKTGKSEQKKLENMEETIVMEEYSLSLHY